MGRIRLQRMARAFTPASKAREIFPGDNRGLQDQDAIETGKPPTRMERAVGRRSASLGFGVGGR
jgi:hypothetical protein